MYRVGVDTGVQNLTAAKFPEASFPTANLFTANFPRTICNDTTPLLKLADETFCTYHVCVSFNEAPLIQVLLYCIALYCMIIWHIITNLL